MNGRWILMSLVTLALASSALVGCGDDDGRDETPVGIPNPASVFCEEQGGTLELVDEADGTVGYCNLPDGTRIEEWEYYRQSGNG